MDLTKYTDYGKYRISNICLQSYPCQHYVIDKESGEERRLFGTDVLRLLDKENIQSSHFEIYRNMLSDN